MCLNTDILSANSAVCDITNVTFTCGSIDVTYVVVLLVDPNLDSGVVEVYYDELFAQIVSEAENGTLQIANNTVDSRTASLGTQCKDNITHKLTSLVLECNLSCLFFCFLVVSFRESQFTIISDSFVDALLNTTTQEYLDLRLVVENGVSIKLPRKSAARTITSIRTCCSSCR